MNTAVAKTWYVFGGRCFRTLKIGAGNVWGYGEHVGRFVVKSVCRVE